MNKKITFFVFIFLCTINLFSQSWQTVGVEDFSKSTYTPSFALDNNNIPYIAFTDYENSHRVTVKKFDGTNWVLVGVVSSLAGEVSKQSLAFGSDNFPYLAFRDVANSNKTTVVKFNGTNWLNIGNIGPSVGFSQFQSLKIDSNNLPYLAHRDTGVSASITIKKFDGFNWVIVGNNLSEIKAVSKTLEIDSNNAPYLAYRDNDNFSRATVRKFDGTNWVLVGNPGFSNTSVSTDVSFALDNNNVPYFAYRDLSLSPGKSSIMKFDGTNWVTVGNVGSVNEIQYYQNIIIDNNNIPYLTYSNTSNLIKTNVKKFDGVNWITVGNADFSNGGSIYLAQAVTTNNKLYLSYIDNNTNKTTVKSYNTLPTATNVTYAGSLTKGQQLSGTYDYADANNDLENGSIYKWYRSDDNVGTNKIAITNATAQNYTLTADDVNKYISFEVTPKDGTSFGTPVESTLQGAVEAISVNSFPTAKTDAVTIPQNSTNNQINVLADNGFGADDFGANGSLNGGLTFTNGTLISVSEQGTISVDNKGTQSTLDDVILYSPNAGFVGVDHFYYMLTDAVGKTAIAQATVTVQQASIPKAIADSVSVLQDSGTTNIDVLANDSFGSDGLATSGSLEVLSATSSQAGNIVVNNNKVDYTPLLGFSGTDTFQYTIKDATNDTSTTIVTITVLTLNSSTKPTAKNDAISVLKNSSNNVINILDDNGSGADSFGSDGPSATHPIALSAFYTDNGGKVDLIGTIVNYTPRIGYTGLDSFKYTLTDLNGDASSATVNITVNINTNVPSTVPDTATINQDTSIILDVLANGDSFGADLAATTNPLTVGVNSAFGGVTTIVPIGLSIGISYTPALGFVGIDTFNYTITDSNGDTATGLVTITVEAVNLTITTITAKKDAVTVFQNTSANSINVLADNGFGADDFGTDGALDNGLTFVNGTKTSLSEQGTIIIDNKTTPSPLDDEIIYTPKTGFIGVDHFYYMLTDSKGKTAIAQVTVTVEQASIPKAAADSVSVLQDSGTTNIDVLVNDSFGSDGPATTGSLVVSLGTSSQGGLIVVTNNKIAYTPALGFIGIDTFEYIIKDATNDTSTAIVNITVNSSNSSSKPTAQNDVVSVNRNSVNNVINILDDNGSGEDSFGSDGPNATHPISLSGTHTDNGSKIDLVGNTVLYTPIINFTGADSFGYTITDANGDASTATVNITIVDANQSNVPTAEDDIVTTLKNNPILIDVLLNDNFGGDGAATNPFFVNSQNQINGFTVNSGVFAIFNNNTPLDNSDDKIGYAPPSDFVGQDSFQYTIRDANGDESTATVYITITNPVNGLPSAVNDILSVNINSVNNVINVLQNDSFGTDGAINNGLTMQNGLLSGTSAAGGSVTINNKGTAITLDDEILYTPKANFIGSDSFTYAITDTNGDLSFAIVSITVIDPNQPNLPIAVNDFINVTKDVGIAIDVLINDDFGANGPGAVPLSFAGANNGYGVSFRGGFFVLNDNQTPNNLLDDIILYIPPSNYLGQDSLEYFITDANGNTSTAKVFMTVGVAVPVNGTPTAVNDTADILINSTNNKIAVLANDSYGTDGPKTTNSLSLPNGLASGLSTNGATITVNNNNTPGNLQDDVILYTSISNSLVSDTFNYVITDANGDTSSATVTVHLYTVLPVPTATTEVISVYFNSQDNLINVLQNDDFGPDGPLDNGLSFLDDSLQIISDQGGSVRIDNKNTNDTLDDVIYFTPRNNYSGGDSFSYKITDATGDISTVAVLINVLSNTPIANRDEYTINTNSVNVPLNILENDYIPTSGSFALNFIANTFGSTLIVNNNGTPLVFSDDYVVYTPSIQAKQVGVDRFNYIIRNSLNGATLDGNMVNINLTSQKNISTLSTTNIELDENKMMVYPNPSKGNFSVTINSDASEQASIILYDVTGKVVYRAQQELSSGKNTMSLDVNVKTGILFLKVYSNTTNFGTKKIVFE